MSQNSTKTRFAELAAVFERLRRSSDVGIAEDCRLDTDRKANCIKQLRELKDINLNAFGCAFFTWRTIRAANRSIDCNVRTEKNLIQKFIGLVVEGRYVNLVYVCIFELVHGSSGLEY